MKTRFLFPHRFKLLGWLLLVPSTLIGVMMMLFGYELYSPDATVFAIYEGGIMEPSKFLTLIRNPVADEVLAVLAIVGGLLAAFSEEREEDEYISQIRLESLLWATYINYGFLLFSVLLIYGLGFYQIMIFNMFTLLFIFLIRFNYVMYRTSKAIA